MQSFYSHPHQLLSFSSGPWYLSSTVLLCFLHSMLPCFEHFEITLKIDGTVIIFFQTLEITTFPEVPLQVITTSQELSHKTRETTTCPDQTKIYEWAEPMTKTGMSLVPFQYNWIFIRTFYLIILANFQYHWTKVYRLAGVRKRWEIRFRVIKSRNNVTSNDVIILEMLAVLARSPNFSVLFTGTYKAQS